MAERVQKGDGFAVSSLDALGEGPGFRKIRRELGVEEMGVNGIVVPAGIETKRKHSQKGSRRKGAEKCREAKRRNGRQQNHS